MARKLVLCASSFHLTAGLWTGRRLSAVHRFDAGERRSARLRQLPARSTRRARST